MRTRRCLEVDIKMDLGRKECWLWARFKWLRTVLGPFEGINQYSCCIESEGCIDKLSDYQLMSLLYHVLFTMILVVAAVWRRRQVI